MPDLEERFRSLGHARTPDLWSDIEERKPRNVPPEPHGSRVLAAVVAFAVAVAGIGVAVRVFTGEEPLRLGRGEPGAVAFVARAGRRAATPAAIYKVTSDGTARTRLTPDDLAVASPAWSSDGRLIAYSSSDGISVMDADGGNPSLLVTDGSGPTWSPDGGRIAFECGGAICIARSDGSDEARLTDPRPALDSAPAWSPDGGWIAFTRSYLDPTQEDVTHLFVMRPDGTGAVDLVSVLGYTEAAWSPDASRIAFSGRAERNERSWEIFVMNSDGTGLTQLTRDEATDGAPTWSPDGAQIAFARVAGEGDADIYVMNADGSGMTRVTSDLADETDPAWQPVPAPSVTEDVTPDPSETPVSEPVRISARVTDTIAISDFPNAIVAGEDGVWVSAPDRSGSGDVVRIDPTTGEVTARIPMEGLPQWEVGGGGMAVGLGSVWVTGTTGGGSSCCSVVVQQIDPGTNQVVDEIDAGPGFDSDIWVDDSGIWVLKFRRDRQGMEVVRFDATDHKVVASSRVAVTWSQTIFRAGPWVWILGTASAAEGPVEPNTLYRIDPITADVIETLELKGSVWQPAVGSDVVWVRVRDGVQRVDLVTGMLVGEPSSPAPGCCTYPFVSDDVGGVWVASSRDSGGDPAVWHVTTAGITDAFAPIDPRDEEAWGGVADAFEPTTQTIWVVHYRDAVSRIELGPAS